MDLIYQPTQSREPSPQSQPLDAAQQSAVDEVEQDSPWGVAALFGNSFLAEMLPQAIEALPEVMGLDQGRQAIPGARGEENDPAAAPTPTDFSTRAQGMFSGMDTDSDGHLSADDIDRAMLDPNLSPEDASTVATMKSLREELEELSNDEWGDEDDGITLEDIREYERTGRVPQELRDRVEGDYAWRRQRLAEGSGALFTDPNNNASIDAIQQGSLGDCWFLAAVGSMVSQDPQSVNRMIADNGDGTYTVTFPGRDPVTVNAPTNAERAYYGSSRGDGMWLSVLEKAYGQVRADGDESGLPQDHMDGGFGKDSIADLTGAETNVDDTAFTDTDTTRDRMEDALSNGRLVTAGISSGPFTADRIQGLPTGHEYTVVGYDRATDTVTLRNPWGRTEHTGADGTKSDGTDDGTFTVTMEEFDDLFSDVTYQQAR